MQHNTYVLSRGRKNWRLYEERTTEAPYIPKFYLAGFTKDGNNQSPLWVFDQKTGRQFQARPGSVAFENDLYTVELEGEPGDVFEKAFAKVETRASVIIRNIINTLSMPDNEDDYIWLMNFIALLAERTPVRRDVFTEPMAEAMKMSLELQFQYRERYDAIKQRMQKDGIDVNDSVTYEELRDFVYDGKYSISFDNNTHLNNLMIASDTIIPYLMARKWSVVTAPPNLGDFVCSDNPVSLHWTKNMDHLGIFNSPGHGLKDTEVSIPLNPRVALLGRFDDFLPPFGIIPSHRSVAIINSKSCMYSKRHIYSRKRDFIWYDKQGRVCTLDDLALSLKKKSRFDMDFEA